MAFQSGTQAWVDLRKKLFMLNNQAAPLRLDKSNLIEARDWIKECLGCWRDLTEEDQVDELTDAEVESAIDRHFCGGVTAFLAA